MPRLRVPHLDRRAARSAARRPAAVILPLCLALVTGLPAPIAQAQPAPAAPVRLPALGESAADDFNASAEKRVGEQIMLEVRRDRDYLDDPQLLDHLQAIWQPLVRAARARGDIGSDIDGLFPYEVFLVRDRSINAFALPGGYVGVHLALIALTSTPDELASVLAHELSHVTQRHIARSVVASQRSTTLSIAAMLLALVAASRANSVDLAQAAVMGGQAAAVQSQLNFSRDMEREADRNGLALLVLAGYSPQGMGDMFERMDQANRHNDNGAWPYLRTHPLTNDRIGEARQRIAQESAQHQPAAQATVPSRLHALMRARARALMDPSTQALRRMQEQLLRARQSVLAPEERLAAAYAATLASLQLKDLATASQGIAALEPLALAHLQDDPAARRAVNRLRAEVALLRGDAAAARAALAADAPDGSRASLLLQADLALADRGTDALRDSADALQLWLTAHRQDAAAWAALSRLSQQQGRALRAVRADAEAHAALGDLRGAIDRLRAGQQQAQRQGAGVDFIEASVIDLRLRELQAQRRNAQNEAARNGGRPEGD